MTNSTEDKIRGGIQEVKGTIKEQVGKLTDDCELQAEGNIEKNVGKVQQKIGHAKEAVAKLQGKLTRIKKAGNAS
jgi:uncharacterized protein YjbJ (UPF0337 family)